jgi:aspartyl protease family protein
MKRLLALCLAVAAAGAWAQSVALQGMMGKKALLMVNGGTPHMVGIGEEFQGVKVLDVLGEQAVVEIGGKRQTLRVGDAPASVGSRGNGGGGGKIVLTAGTGGHFLTPGSINGHAVQFMVDTGATDVALGADEAQRLGIDYRKGMVGRGATANGIVSVYRVKLSSVRIGDVEVHDVDASVLPSNAGPILLGNSFLTRFQMTRFNDQLVLERRY